MKKQTKLSRTRRCARCYGSGRLPAAGGGYYHCPCPAGTRLHEQHESRFLNEQLREVDRAVLYEHSREPSDLPVLLVDFHDRLGNQDDRDLAEFERALRTDHSLLTDVLRDALAGDHDVGARVTVESFRHPLDDADLHSLVRILAALGWVIPGANALRAFQRLTEPERAALRASVQRVLLPPRRRRRVP